MSDIDLTQIEVNQGIREHRFRSWLDFCDHIRVKHAGTNAYVYRGQADAKWLVESSVDRLEKRYPSTTNPLGGIPDRFDVPPATREIHLNAFKEAVVGKRGSHPRNLLADEWWALAQHHGLPTPLLDWAFSPFVALFFAFEEEAYCDWENKQLLVPEARAVYGMSFHMISDRGTDAHPPPTVFSVRREVTQRIGNQTGVFLMMPKGTDLESNVRGRFDNETSQLDEPLHMRANRYPCWVLEKFIIPNKGRLECLSYLNKMNINRLTLFPDLDGAAAYITRLWEMGFQTPLGATPEIGDGRWS